MIGQSSSPPWLMTDWLLGQFGTERQQAITRYIDFIRAGVGLPTLWEKLQNQIYLGSEQFVQRMQRTITSLQALQEVPRAQRRAVAKPLDHYASLAANAFLGMALAYRSGDYTMKTIADHFGVHYTTVSRAVREYETTGSEK